MYRPQSLSQTVGRIRALARLEGSERRGAAARHRTGISHRVGRDCGGFAERNVMECLGRLDHSGLMLAARITLPHFSVSSAMSLPESAGVPDNALPPTSARRGLNVGSTSATLISLLSLPMISAGVPVRTPTPYQVLAS